MYTLYQCPHCHWEGKQEQMLYKQEKDTDGQTWWSNYVCPGCHTWWSLEDYVQILKDPAEVKVKVRRR